eukprot:scaffold2388_cov237-Pinguiococcus_pyrenoidosus.AAC.5
MAKLSKHDRAEKAMAPRRIAKDFVSSSGSQNPTGADYADLAALRRIVTAAPEAAQGLEAANDDEGGADERAEAGKAEGEADSDCSSDLDAELDAFVAEMEELGIEDERQLTVTNIQRAAEKLGQMGIGRHVALPHGAAVLDAIGICNAVVIHLTPSCGGAAAACVDVCLEAIAPSFMGTRFLRLPLSDQAAVTALQTAGAPIVRDDQSCTEYGGVLLAFRRASACGVEMRPSDVIGKGLVEDVADLQRSSPELIRKAQAMLESWLDSCDVLDTVAPSSLPDLAHKADSGHLGPVLQERSGEQQSDVQKEAADDVPEEDFFHCGLEGCHKSFSHCHVGLEVPKEFIA